MEDNPESVERMDEKAANLIKKLPKESNDTEAIHVIADDILCHALEAMGFKKTVKAFKKLEKWYA